MPALNLFHMVHKPKESRFLYSYHVDSELLKVSEEVVYKSGEKEAWSTIIFYLSISSVCPFKLPKQSL